jgi:hypothetical protein
MCHRNHNRPELLPKAAADVRESCATAALRRLPPTFRSSVHFIRVVRVDSSSAASAWSARSESGGVVPAYEGVQQLISLRITGTSARTCYSSRNRSRGFALRKSVGENGVRRPCPGGLEGSKLGLARDSPKVISELVCHRESDRKGQEAGLLVPIGRLALYPTSVRLPARHGLHLGLRTASPERLPELNTALTQDAAAAQTAPAGHIAPSWMAARPCAGCARCREGLR